MPESVLAAQLRVEPAGEGRFRARLRDFEGVSFGGDVLARLALAAGATATERRLHALHATFVRPVASRDPIAIHVESLGDGRTLARRRAWIERDDKILCHATASFCADAAPDPSWQEVEALDAPDPDSLPPDEHVMREEGRDVDEDEEFAWGFVDRPWRAWDRGEPASSGTWRVWMRPRQPLPDDPRLHDAALVYVSDLVSHWSVCMRLGLDPGPGFYLSLDHALHVHRPLAWDDWWLMENRSEIAGGGRALWQRRVFTRDGALVASIQQEGLIRLPAATRV